MLTYLRYALATVCFAASVGGLGLWSRSFTVRSTDGDIAPIRAGARSPRALAWNGDLYLALGTPAGEAIIDYPVALERYGWFERTPSRRDRFVFSRDAIVCPLWYPALIFALVGVGIFRFRRQFSIRSALVCFTMVAALLGMAVML